MSRRKQAPDDASTSAEASVPKGVVSRLSLYLRELQRLHASGKQTISSTQLGRLLGVTDAQVRKDFAYFGQFGYPGIGYRCQNLIEEIRRILGTDRVWPVALVGCGNLGQALLGYRGFTHQGFSIVAGFDVDPDLVGQRIEGREIYQLSRLPAVAAEQSIRVGILAVPAAVAPDVAARMVQAGIQGILNFAPVTLSLPLKVHVVGVDLAMELEQLSFSLVKQSAVVRSSEKR